MPGLNTLIRKLFHKNFPYVLLGCFLIDIPVYVTKLYFIHCIPAEDNLYNSQRCGLYSRQLHGEVLIVVFCYSVDLIIQAWEDTLSSWKWLTTILKSCEHDDSPPPQPDVLKLGAEVIVSPHI